MLLILTDCNVLATLNIPAEFCLKLVFPSRGCAKASSHVTLGLGNQLLAKASREPCEKLNVGAENAETVKVVSKKS